jgi:hypothetical protein
MIDRINIDGDVEEELDTARVSASRGIMQRLAAINIGSS